MEISGSKTGQAPTIRLTPEVHKRLKIKSAKTGDSVQVIATRAVIRHLNDLDAQEAHADDVA